MLQRCCVGQGERWPRASPHGCSRGAPVGMRLALQLPCQKPAAVTPRPVSCRRWQGFGAGPYCDPVTASGGPWFFDRVLLQSQEVKFFLIVA